MIEILIPMTIGGVIATMFRTTGNRKKIETFFETRKICVDLKGRRLYPKFKKETTFKEKTVYHYRLPIGIPSKALEQFDETLSEGLGKPVTLKWDNYMLAISVYKKKLEERIPFTGHMLRTNTWQVPIGMTVEGLVYHDFEQIPHITVSGTSGFGKTVLLKLVSSSLLASNPNHSVFYFIDLKEKLEFHEWEELGQTKGVAGNPHEAHELLTHIVQDMFNMIEYLREQRVTNISESDIKQRVFVFVDEAAELTPHGSPKQKAMLRDCQFMLSEIARLGRAIGYRLIFGTQYPTGDTLPRQIKQNADCKIGFRLPTQIASMVAIDEDGLERLPQIRGRAIMKTVTTTEMQVPYLSDTVMRELLQKHGIEREKNHEQPQASETNQEQEPQLRPIQDTVRLL
ncbi:TPA: cell division protein FtsK [Bacillus cereus]|nr:cell division protein FtsK [Bacillus cereus]